MRSVLSVKSIPLDVLQQYRGRVLGRVQLGAKGRTHCTVCSVESYPVRHTGNASLSQKEPDNQLRSGSGPSTSGNSPNGWKHNHASNCPYCEACSHAKALIYL